MVAIHSEEAAMRYVTLLVVTALAVLLAASSAADARKKHRSVSLVGIITSPLRMLAPRARGSRANRSRASAARAPSQERAGVVAATPAAATPATTTPAAPAAPAGASVFNAYEDILGYALWPNDYANRFWTRGYGDIMRSVILPAATVAAADDDSAKERRGRRTVGARTSDADRDLTSAVSATGMCSAKAKEQASEPINRIEQTVELTDAQRLKLQALRTAVSTAVERGMAACRETPPRTPADRLKAMTDGLWAMRDADILFRTPLDNFYRSLTDWQQAQLAPGASGAAATATEACGRASNAMPIDEIAQAVQPTREQSKSLDMLQGISADLSKYLASACPLAMPSTPVGRLDAAGNRVAAMLYAAMNLDPVLSGFYFQLNDEQKQKFDSIGR
jgi:hypothetical protein